MSGLRKGSSEDRHCGSCTACCTQLPIPAGVVGVDAKPAGTPCPHVGALGCRIYARRPDVCSRFSCVWLRDPAWPPAWRPDRAGLLCLREMLEGKFPVAAVYEIQVGALQRPEASDMLNELVRTTATVAVIDVQCQRQRLEGRWSSEETLAANAVRPDGAGSDLVPALPPAPPPPVKAA